MARSDFHFSFGFRIRYSEIDGQSIVFNAHYLTYFDTAVTEFLRVLEFDLPTYIRETKCDLHTVKTVVEYHAPVRLDEFIDVHVRFARMGNSSVSFGLEIYVGDEQDPRTSGEVVWVNSAVGAHKSVPLDDDFRQLLQRQSDLVLSN